jgi:hypothetical protein
VKLYKMRFEVIEIPGGPLRQFMIHMEAYQFEAAVESAKLYVKKHLDAYEHKRIVGVDEIGEVQKPDAP